MLKVIVIGCPGAGKSIFARALRDATDLPLHHLDQIWHKPDKSNISEEEFDERLNQIIQGEKWIIDGNYQRTLEVRLAACDTVFLLDYPLEVCLAGAQSRIGTKREDLPWVETEFDEEFKQWITDFPKAQLPNIYELLERHREGKDIFVLKSRTETEQYLNCISGIA